jgi:hypothetical protein
MDRERGTFKVNDGPRAGREIKGLIPDGPPEAAVPKFWAAESAGCYICLLIDHFANEAFIFSAEILGTDLGQAGWRGWICQRSHSLTPYPHRGTVLAIP